MNPVTRTAAVSLELARARALLHLGTDPVNAAAERRFARDLDAVRTGHSDGVYSPPTCRVGPDGIVRGWTDDLDAVQLDLTSLLPAAPIRPGDASRPPRKVLPTFEGSTEHDSSRRNGRGGKG